MAILRVIPGLLEARAGNHVAARKHLMEVIEFEPTYTMVRVKTYMDTVCSIDTIYV